MEKLSAYSELIKKIAEGKDNPVRCNVSKWWIKKENEIPDIGHFIEKNEISISRTELLKEENLERKLIGTLLWGYPQGMRGGYLNDILNNRQSIISLIQSNSNNYENLINKLFSTRGLGLATITKLLYFNKIETDAGCFIPIIDRYVRDAMAIFSEFKGIAINRDMVSYIRDISRLFSTTVTDANYDDVEFFLFTVGKEWEAKEMEYKQKFIKDYLHQESKQKVNNFDFGSRCSTI